MKHNKKLGKLMRKAEGALRVFVKTQQKLEKHNVQLEAIVNDAEAEVARLREIAENARKHREHNNTVVENIKKLLA